jgi:hypothetical protein
VYTPEVGSDSGDELLYSVSDGQETSAPTKFEFKLLSVDAVPYASKTVGAVIEDSKQGVLITLNGSDSDSKFVTFVITELPRMGKLYMVTGELIRVPFSAFEVRVRSELRVYPSSLLSRTPMQVPVPLPPMYASTVKNVSSFWPAGPNPKLPPCPFAMPANSSAEKLGCGYPQWHPFQILGLPSTSRYGDSDESWCPSSRLGDSGFAAGGDSYIRFAWDPSLSFQKDGFTEFIEVGFSSAVYVHSIEIGEPRGMGSVVRIRALDPSGGDYYTLWESPDGEGDPTVQYRYNLRTEYRVFRPFPICQTTFKTDTIRIEMDTRTVTDWNELDYVQLTGSLALPHGALPQGVNMVIYVPDPNAFGEDVFSYTLSDCAFQPWRQALPATVAVSILGVNDAPVAANYTISDLASLPSETNNGTSLVRIDLAKSVSDVDGDELIYSIDQLRGEATARLEKSLLLVASDPQHGFGLRYTATDPSNASSHGFVTFWPRCSNGIIDGTRCIPCATGTHARKDQDGRVECRPCNPGQFQPDVGQYGCLNCDSLGDFFQELQGQTFCVKCPQNTRRFLGVLSAANRTACQCKEGVAQSGKEARACFLPCPHHDADRRQDSCT